MFEARGWVEVDVIVGPVPVAPCPWWTTSELLAWAVRAPFTGAWVDALRAAPASTRLERIRLAQAWDRLRQGADAGFLTAVGSISEQRCPTEPESPACPGGTRCTHDWSREELAAALHLAPQTVSTLLLEARELVGRCHPLLTAVSDGRLPGYAARRLARTLAAVPDDAMVTTILGRVMRKVGTLTPGQLDRLTTSTLDSLRDPTELAAAHQRASRRDTGITPGQPLADGIGSATITAPTPQIAEFLAWARTFTTTNKTPGDPRTVGQRRVHALLNALTPTTGVSATGGEHGGTGRTEQGPAGAGAAQIPDRRDAAHQSSVYLRLIMTADTLLGRTNDPAWLTGAGTIPAYLARQLAITPAALQQALHDSKTGKLLDLGRDHRFALADLDQHIRAQDLTCTWPGCTRSSDTNQLDHLQPWAQGGITSAVNLHPPCPRHHRARDAGWQPSRLPDNRGMRWQSPLGVTYQTGNGSDTNPGPDDRPDEDDWDPLDPRNQPHAPQRPPPEDPPF